MSIDRPLRAGPAAPPGLYVFIHELIFDVFCEPDMVRHIHHFLSVVDDGTVFHLVFHVAEGKVTPKSAKCMSRFMDRWTYLAY